MSAKWLWTVLAMSISWNETFSSSHRISALLRVRSSGAEAGHGHGQHVGGGAAQLLHGTHGHQQGQAAVQPARDADDGRSWRGHAPAAWPGRQPAFSKSAHNARPGSCWLWGTKGVGSTQRVSTVSVRGRLNSTVVIAVLPRARSWCCGPARSPSAGNPARSRRNRPQKASFQRGECRSRQ